MQSEQVTPIPPGSVLLHIGPHKTGTTAAQHAFRAAAEDLLDQGVRYAGTRPGRDAEAARHAIGGRALRDADRAARAWGEVRDRLRDTAVARRAFSSETLAHASDAVAARLADELDRPHVVITARPLADVLPSQYGQFVQRGLTDMPFQPWVDAVLHGTDGDRTTRIFWKRHRLDRQVERWSAAVGAERVIVLVPGHDRSFLAAAFERLLALRPGTLAERLSSVRTNRSLSAAEIELVRAWHLRAAAAGLDAEELRRLTWQVCEQLRTADPRPDAARLALPRRAVVEANQRGAQIAAGIARSGVQVVGDLAVLSAVPALRSAPPAAAGAIDVDLAAAFAVAVRTATCPATGPATGPAPDRSVP